MRPRTLSWTSRFSLYTRTESIVAKRHHISDAKRSSTVTHHGHNDLARFSFLRRELQRCNLGKLNIFWMWNKVAQCSQCGSHPQQIFHGIAHFLRRGSTDSARLFAFSFLQTRSPKIAQNKNKTELRFSHIVVARPCTHFYVRDFGRDSCTHIRSNLQ